MIPRGFTLIELLLVIAFFCTALAGGLIAFAFWAWAKSHGVLP